MGQHNGKRLVGDTEVDDALVNYMNEKYFAGVAHVGERLMAGLMSEVPEFSKTGRRTTPRAWRCLHLARGGLVRCSMGGDGERAHTQGYRLMVVALLLGLQAFLRLGELIQLREVDLIGAKKLEPDRVSGGKKPPDKNWALDDVSSWIASG